VPDDEAVEKADEDPRDGLQRVDLASGLLDSRVVVLLAWLGEWHTLAVTALRSDHSYLTKAGVVSNHAHGRAVDVGAVDGELMCRNTGRSGSVSSWATSSCTGMLLGDGASSASRGLPWATSSRGRPRSRR